ncbi:Hypothetical protein CINCED_3A020980 [Cinara cedri]|uniref:Uncharacterized protein n=1 Tax=Cinara cedri TaxID=506608 RepID=A0A5E4M311_9HEMI|nr:Hypothetical protein CINCED_3A020980 [Cinara cedri]
MTIFLSVDHKRRSQNCFMLVLSIVQTLLSAGDHRHFVPKVNRGPIDPANVIAIAMKHKNGLNRLGTEHGIVKGRYGSGNNIQPATSGFISIDRVKTKEMSIRKTVLSLNVF